ncbi:unnamed protein product [Closterium sp. NIES-53]
MPVLVRASVPLSPSMPLSPSVQCSSLQATSSSAPTADLSHVQSSGSPQRGVGGGAETYSSWCFFDFGSSGHSLNVDCPRMQDLADLEEQEERKDLKE